MGGNNTGGMRGFQRKEGGAWLDSIYTQRAKPDTLDNALDVGLEQGIKGNF